MNILSFFIIVPLLMLASLWASRSVNQVRGVMVVGSSILLALSVYLTIDYIELRQAGATIFHVVHSIECRGIRILRFNRPVHHVHVL